MGDGFYRSKDPTNSIKVLKEQIVHRQKKLVSFTLAGCQKEATYCQALDITQNTHS